jgi:hypothetical protein
VAPGHLACIPSGRSTPCTISFLRYSIQVAAFHFQPSLDLSKRGLLLFGFLVVAPTHGGDSDSSSQHLGCAAQFHPWPIVFPCSNFSSVLSGSSVRSCLPSLGLRFSSLHRQDSAGRPLGRAPVLPLLSLFRSVGRLCLAHRFISSRADGLPVPICSSFLHRLFFLRRCVPPSGRRTTLPGFCPVFALRLWSPFSSLVSKSRAL